MKVYKQKIKYHNLQGDFPKGTIWEERSMAYWNSNVYLPKDFVENNPDIFELDYTRLLEEANKRYPIGTKYITANPSTQNKATIIGKLCITSVLSEETVKCNGIRITDGWGGSVYYDGKWAEIIKDPLFTTEDGVDIYEGDIFWYPNIHVWKVYSTEANQKNIEYVIKTNKYKTFSTGKSALDYVYLNEPKYSKQDIMDAVKNGENNLGPKRVHGADEIIKLIFKELDKNE